MDSNVFNLKINLNNIKHTQTINGLKLIKNEDIDLLYLGNIYDKKSERISIKELSELYKNFGEKINLYLDGIYSLCIIDYKKIKFLYFKMILAVVKVYIFTEMIIIFQYLTT